MVHTRGKGFEEFKLLKRQEKIAERKRFVKFICLRLKANKILEWLEEPQLQKKKFVKLKKNKQDEFEKKKFFFLGLIVY